MKLENTHSEDKPPILGGGEGGQESTGLRLCLKHLLLKIKHKIKRTMKGKKGIRLARGKKGKETANG